MSFRVHKSLGNSSFQFAVGRRRDFASIDDDRELSTGPAGEFVRHRPEIFYSADLRTIHQAEVPVPRSSTSVPFWSSVFEPGPRRGLMIGLMAVGGLFVLMGLAVLASKGKQGLVEVVLGLILMAIPVAMTSQRRRHLRSLEERVRREREERDARDRELLAAYTSSLDRLREDPSDASLLQVRRENEKLDLPYAVWADTAIGTVLYVGFSTLAKVGAERASEVAALMDRASDAAGLLDEDARAVKHALYATVLWHLIADDRLGKTQLEIVRSVQQGFGLRDEDIPLDVSAEAQFHRLRGVDHRKAPRCEAPVPLGMNEYCMYTTTVRRGEASTTVFITNRRFIVDGDKRLEIQVPKIDDVIVDADHNRVTVRASELKKPLEMQTDEPIYLAAMLDLATRLDDRPKSFA